MLKRNLFALVPIGLVVILSLFVATRSEVRDPQVGRSNVNGNTDLAGASQTVNSDSLQHRAIKSPSGRQLVY